MSKYEFEWTDEQADQIQQQLLADTALGLNVAQQIEAQKPVPLPTKIGAVIRGKVYEISQDRTFICAGFNRWIEADGDIYQIPPIKTWTVLSEGVDL